jgi:surfactin family lipopeptide synthetase C
MNKLSKKNIETIYPLSPLQQGILFHSLMEPESGVYFNQLNCKIEGSFHPGFFQHAWQQIIERHGVLRTRFLWQTQQQPLQVVCRQTSLPWQIFDWRGRDSNQQQQQLQQWLINERKEGFNLEKVPPLQLTLIQMDEQCYQFIWSHHHLILDGWSNAIVFKEVLELYEASLSGQTLVLPPVRPYQDYIYWLQQQDRNSVEQYWKQYLDGFQTPIRLQLPIPILDEPIDLFFKEYSLNLSVEQTKRLQNMIRVQRLTMNTLVQGAWALLLNYYSGQQDVLFGSTVSGRPSTLPDVEKMVGMFINTLPVRVKIDPDLELGQWLHKIQQQQSDQEAYIASSLVDIQACSEIPSGQPLFDTLIVFENYPVDQAVHQEDENLRVSHMQTNAPSNYPLDLTILDDVELGLRLTYDTHLFEEKTIIQLINHFQNLLIIMADGSVERPISEFSLLNDVEREYFLYDLNQTEIQFPVSSCVHELFEQQVERTPDAIALVHAQQQLTYQQLNERANQLAHYLQTFGVAPDSLVGICVDRSLEMVVGILGILKAGGAYVPLASHYPSERLDYMLRDADIKMLLTQKQLVASLPSYAGKVICLDEEWEAIEQRSRENLTTNVTAEHLAYVIYTSGSTGQPKGVLVPHQNLVNAYFAWEETYQLQTRARNHLQMANFSFDVFAGDFVRSLCSGGKLIICPMDFLLNAEELYKLMVQQGTDSAEFVPAVIRNLMEYLEETQQDLSFMKVLVVGSDSWYREEHEKLRKLCHERTHLINSYGVTEATIDSCYFDGFCTQEKLDGLVPIGRPFANVQMYILNDYQQLVPDGVSGELYIGGAGVARGYLNQPELTQEKFVANPFSSDKSARLYKTGDLARYLSDGNIEFLGRIDNQVKIRGFRIELDEIEATLNQHSEVQHAVVVANGELNDKQLVAYVILTDGITSLESLREHLKSKLPDYMIPARFVNLDSFPLNANGKIDRLAVSTSAGIELDTTVQYTPPQTYTQERIVQIWSMVLNREKVGIHENFFELGGHSLLATQVVSRLRDYFNVELSLLALFENPTVILLADFVDKKLFDHAESVFLEQLLSKVDELSDAEVHQQLFK